MRSSLLERLQNAFSEPKEPETAFTCHRCGSSINSVLEAPRVDVGSEILLFCSENCHRRFMKIRVSEQIRLTMHMFKHMRQQREKGIFFATA